MEILQLIGLVSVILLLLQLVWQTGSRRKLLVTLGDLIPGPKAYPIVGNIFNFKLVGPHATESWMDGMKKYGYTFRLWLGPNLHIAICDPDDMQMIMTNPTFLTKSEPYNLLDSWLGTGLLISTGDLWHKRRKAITPAFHFRILEEFVPTFNKCAGTLVRCLEKKVGEDFFPVTGYMSNCALDTIAETAMGTEIRAQTNPLEQYPSAVFRMTKSLTYKIFNPIWGMEPFYTMSGYRKRESTLLKTLLSVPRQVLEKKKNMSPEDIAEDTTEELAYGAKKKTAFLEMLLKMKQENAPAFQTDQDILDEVITFMFEGHDTTTMVLSYTTWLLGLHPDIQKELYNEVSGILGDREPVIEDLHTMQYLERVLKESLRMYPPAPVIGRLSTKSFVLPSNGMVIPPGAQVSLFIYSMHRREDLFPEPEKFNPDRFLEPLKHPFSYLPFSAGPRNCIGQKFAMLELKAVISKLVLNFKIESDSNLVLSPELLLRSSNGPNIRLTLRNQSNK